MDRRIALLAMLFGLLVVGGCELIAGLHDRSLECQGTCADATTDGATDVAPVPDAGCGTLTLCTSDAGSSTDAGDAGSKPPYCANLQTDPTDCGKCGHVCPLGSSCDAGACSCTYKAGTQTFNYTGAMQTFAVPGCVTSVTITAYGAEGANANDVSPSTHAAGKGGSATGVLTVTPGETLNVYVGGQGGAGVGGWNGGGTGGTSTAGAAPCVGGPSGGGGGMSDVRASGTAWATS